MDYTVHGITKVGQDSDFHFHLFTVHLQYQVQGLGLNECVIFLSVTLFVGILEVSIEGMFLQKVLSLFLLSVFEFLSGWHFFFFFFLVTYLRESLEGMLMFSHPVMSNSLRPPWTIVCQAPLSVGLNQQEYWSVLPFLPPMHESEK